MTFHSDPNWPSMLIDLLEQQRSAYAQLQSFSEQQSRLIEESEAEKLLGLLSQRQGVIDRLSQINRQLDPYRQQWPELWAGLDAPMRRRVQGLIDEVQVMLDQIVARDDEDRASLLAQRKRMAEQLHQLHRGSAVNRAYGQSSTAAGPKRLTDHEG